MLVFWQSFQRAQGAGENVGNPVEKLESADSGSENGICGSVTGGGKLLCIGHRVSLRSNATPNTTFGGHQGSHIVRCERAGTVFIGLCRTFSSRLAVQLCPLLSWESVQEPDFGGVVQDGL